MTISYLLGIGWSIREKLEDHPTCGAVRRHFTRTADLQAVLGAKLGERVWQMVRGIDTRPVFSATTNESTGSPPSLTTSPTTTTVGGTGNTRKSIGAEVNWGVRFETEDQFRRFMVELVDEVVERLRDPSGFPAGVMIPATGSHTPTWRTRAVTVKLRLRHPEAPVEPEKYLGCGWCNSYSHTVQLFQDVDDAPALVDAALGAFGELRRRLGAMFAFEDVRGCGVMCGKLMFDDGTVARQPSQKRIGELLEMQKERTNKRHAVNDGTSADVSFVNPSQVDTSVLDELPADIQQEIRRGMLKRHSSRNTTIIPSTPPAKQRNLRQHTATPSPRMASTRTLDDYFSPSKELRSPLRMNDGTVVDPATWASLPEEIRRELAEEARRIRPMRARSGVKSEALRHDEDGRDFRSKLIILPRETAAFPLMTMDMAEIQQQIHTWLNSDEGDIDDLEEDLVSLQENLLDLVDHLQYDRVDAVLRIMQREAMGVGEHDHVTQSVLKLAQVIRKAMRDNAMGSG